MNHYIITLCIILCCGCKTTSSITQDAEAEKPHYVTITRTTETEQTNFNLDVNSPQKEQLAILEVCFSPVGLDFNASWKIDHKIESQFLIEGEETPKMQISMYRSYKQAKANNATPFPHILNRHSKDADFLVFCGIPSPTTGRDRMIDYIIPLLEDIRKLIKMQDDPQQPVQSQKNETNKMHNKSQ